MDAWSACQASWQRARVRGCKLLFAAIAVLWAGGALAGSQTFSPGSPLPSGTAGSAYSQTITASPNGGGTWTWSISSGALPPGLSLGPGSGNQDTITGTPTTGGTYNFTISVAESPPGNFGSQAYALTINGTNVLTVSPS